MWDFIFAKFDFEKIGFFSGFDFMLVCVICMCVLFFKFFFFWLTKRTNAQLNQKQKKIYQK